MMRSSWKPLLLVLGFLPLAVGCAASAPGAASFSGREADVRLSPDRVREAPALPREGFEVMGRVAARCAVRPLTGEATEGWLSEIGCSALLLRQALRERAASVGGELLVGPRCTVGGGCRIRCEGRVARRLAGSAAPAAKSEELWPVRESPHFRASDAWEIRVRYVPSEPNRVARRADLVHEVPELPAGDAVLGNIEARCLSGCELSSVRDAVRAVAARAGAHRAVGVACVATTGEASGWLCTGRASGYAVDPEREPAAR